MPPMPCDLPQLQQRIVEAAAAIDREMLQHMWQELITGLTSVASPRVDISSTCKVGQKLGVSLPLLTCAAPSPPPGDHPSYCTAEFGNPGGTYELPCIYAHTHRVIHSLMARL
jgi:hypothetical protein